MTADDIAKLNARLARNTFSHWMGLVVADASDGEVDIRVPWRDEFISNPEARFAHGGILATLIDTAAAYSIATRIPNSVRTIDMRIDYHVAARPGELLASGRIVRLGRRIATADASVFSADGTMTTSGRATFFIMPHGAGESG